MQTLREPRRGDSNADEFQCQLGHEKGCEKDRQKPLSGASEGDNLVLSGDEAFGAARVPAIANLQGVASSLDRYLDRLVHFDRPGPAARAAGRGGEAASP